LYNNKNINLRIFFQSLDTQASISDFSTAVDEAASKVRDIASNVEADMKNYLTIRLIFLHASFAFVGLVVILGLFSAIFGKPKLSFATAQIGFLTLSCVWFAFGVHLAATVATIDVCNAMDELRANVSLT
jgi:hypothetical protein